MLIELASNLPVKRTRLRRAAYFAR
ncbi:hypothetical protein [Xylophilus ampelinus]